MYFTYFLSALKTQKPKAVKNTKNTINEKMGKTDTPSMLDNAFLNIVLFVLNSFSTLPDREGVFVTPPFSIRVLL